MEVQFSELLPWGEGYQESSLPFGEAFGKELQASGFHLPLLNRP